MSELSIWNISVSATVRGPAPGGGVVEARVSMPLHIKRVGEDVVKDLLAMAQLPLGPQGDTDWDLS